MCIAQLVIRTACNQLHSAALHKRVILPADCLCASQGLQAMLRLPRSMVSSIQRLDLDSSKDSGPLRAAHALAAAAGAAADVATDSDVCLSDASALAAVQAAASVVAKASLPTSSDQQLVAAPDSTTVSTKGGRVTGISCDSGSGKIGASCDALRLAASGCEALAALLPRLPPGGRRASEAVADGVSAVTQALAWAAGLRRVPKAIQQQILGDGCAALAAAAAYHPVGRQMLRPGSSADWNRQLKCLPQAVPPAMWQKLQPAAQLVSAALAGKLRKSKCSGGLRKQVT